jgi:hypothetical protein
MELTTTKVLLLVTGSQGFTPYYYSGNWASDILGLNKVCKDFHDFVSIYNLLEESPTIDVSGHHYVGNGEGCRLGVILPADFFLRKKGEMIVNDEVATPILESITETIKQVLTAADINVELFCPNIRS